MDPHHDRHCPWYPAPYNPHRVYLIPHPNDPCYQKIQNSSGYPSISVDRPRSRCSNLHPALAVETTKIHYDLRKATRDGIPRSTYQQIVYQPAFAQPTYDVRLISKAFPWTIDIRAPTGSVGAIFESLYAMLQEPITELEWSIIVAHDKPKKEMIESAAKARHGMDREKTMRLKRIDWLGDTTVFKGLERDEQFEKERSLPGARGCKETWVITFGKLQEVVGRVETVVHDGKRPAYIVAL